MVIKWKSNVLIDTLDKQYGMQIRKKFYPKQLKVEFIKDMQIVWDKKQTNHLPIAAKSLCLGKRITESKELEWSVEHIRLEQPGIGTRQLLFVNLEKIKIGKDALFDYLRSENLLIYPKKRYTKNTFSKHWLRKYPNLLKTTFSKEKNKCL